MKDKIRTVIVPFALLLLMCLFVAFLSRLLKGPTVSSVMKRRSDTESAAASEKQGEEPSADLKKMDDRRELYTRILKKAKRGLFAGHPADDQFLSWIDRTYGEKVVDAVSKENGSESMVWREQTGKSMHVLWTEFCGKYGYESYEQKKLIRLECKDKNLVKLDFIGDLNLADDWCTMETVRKEKGIENCISADLRKELSGADLTLANHECTLGDKGEPVEGKDYTFRGASENVSILKKLGIDMVSLANNHSYDYGKEALLETMRILEKEKITAIGAGEDRDHAQEPGTIIANGWKIGIVTATEVERFSNFTKEATESEAGVFKMTDPEDFLQKVKETKAECDFVIAYVHWGQEGESKNSRRQHRLAEQIAEAGADAIIGGHPHRLQGMEFIGEVPVIYSLGNFWLSDSALFTVAAQVAIADNGKMELRMIPLMQEQVKTSIIKDKELLTRYYQYFSDMSEKIAVDVRGKVYNLNSEYISAEKILAALSKSKLEWYRSGQAYSRHNADRDVYGKHIDIVGNIVD